MASRADQKQIQVQETDGLKGLEDLLTEDGSRKVSGNNNGTLRSTFPRSEAAHVGIEEGSLIQISMHDGTIPVVVDEPCLIVRPHPAMD